MHTISEQFPCYKYTHHTKHHTISCTYEARRLSVAYVGVKGNELYGNESQSVSVSVKEQMSPLCLIRK